MTFKVMIVFNVHQSRRSEDEDRGKQRFLGNKMESFFLIYLNSSVLFILCLSFHIILV